MTINLLKSETNMKQTLDNYTGTRWWIPQIVGNFSEDQIMMYNHFKPEFKFPDAVKAQIESKWEDNLRQVGAEIGEEGKDWKLVPDEPYQKMVIPDGKGDWKLRMFAGPQTRINDYQIVGKGKLALIHSQTNYAESMATNNSNLYELIEEYKNRNALADGHAVSIAVLGRDDNDQKIMQYFERGKGLGEYGGYTGSAAGNSHFVSKDPFTIAKMEAREESGIITVSELPFDHKVIGHELDVPVISYITNKGKEEFGYLVPDDKFRLMGLALNIDADDRDKSGNRKPHHKSEYLFIADTGLHQELLDSNSKGWRRVDEHVDVMYVPVTMDSLMDMALSYAPSAKDKHMMPPTQALTMAVIRNEFGQDAYDKGIKAINAKYPLFDDQPFFDQVKKGNYQLPKYIIQE